MPKSTRYETTDASGLMKLTRQKPRPPAAKPPCGCAARRHHLPTPPTDTFQGSKQGSDKKSGFLLGFGAASSSAYPRERAPSEVARKVSIKSLALCTNNFGGDAFTYLADDRQSSNTRSAPATVRLVVEEESDVAVAVTALRESLVSRAPAREAFRVTVTTPRWRPCRS